MCFQDQADSSVSEENRGAIMLTENARTVVLPGLSTARTKHIDVCFVSPESYFVRRRSTYVQFVAPKEQHVDILTRTLAAHPFEMSP